MQIVLLIFFITIVLFIWGKYPPDIVALLSLLLLFLSGIIDQGEALSGFSNPTVVMIAALFIIGEGLASTGWTALAAQQFIRWAGASTSKMVVILTLGSGALSGFVSNTGTVATLLPVTVSSAWKIGIVPSKMLMPVAFGSNTGGLLTLTGTPPNIIASNALLENGLEGFSFFEFALIGLPLLLVAVLFIRFWGYQLLPNYETKSRPVSIDSEISKYLEDYSIDGTIYRLRIRSMSPMINTKIEDWKLEEKYQLSILRIKRRHPHLFKGIPEYVEFPTPKTELYYHDIITVQGRSADIDRLMVDLSLGLLPIDSMKTELKESLINQEVGMAEVIVTPRSFFVGKQLPMGSYLEKLDIQLLGISRNNQALSAPYPKFQPGDALIVRGTWQNIEQLHELYENLVISGQPEWMSKDVDQLTYKSWIALGSLVLMVVCLVGNWLPGSVAALVSAAIVVLSRCVPLSKIYRSISWGSVIMIAAMIPMGTALQKTGLAQLVADSLVGYLGTIGPVVVLGGIFILTALFSQTINNSATAVLMAPIAILAAQNLAVSPQPFMIMVAISASTSFLTPVGTTTNAMVMTAGGYKFMDYVRLGSPLLVLFFLISMILVPLIWPF